LQKKLEEKLRQLGEEPAQELMVSIDRLKRKLQTDRIGILIDNLEPALESSGVLISAHRGYVELLRVLTDPMVKSLTLITSRERLHEQSISVRHYPLHGLDVVTWEQFFQGCEIEGSSEAVNCLQYAYGGNAKAMDLLSSIIVQDYAGNAEAYWQENKDNLLIEQDLEDLVAGQFVRLYEHDPDAYKLLCRMGCYRYQDVATVSLDGVLCLLWDVLEADQKRVIKRLQERSLVEYEKQEFWLHPVIRSKAIEYLRQMEDWREANDKARSFWTESVSTIRTNHDAKKAIEAYAHSMEIKDFISAASILIKHRVNSLGKRETLARSFYKLGFLKSITNSIDPVLGELSSGYPRAKLTHAKAAVHWLLGDIHTSIQYCAEAIEMATQLLDELSRVSDHDSEILIRAEEKSEELKLEEVKINSLLTMSLCSIGFWELKKSLNYLNQATSICNRVNPVKYLPSVLFYIAFVKANLNDEKERQEALEISNQLYQGIVGNTIPDWATAYRLHYLGLAYKQLGELDRAFEIHRKAISHAEKSLHIHAKYKNISGLGQCFRKRGSFEESIRCHSEALDFFREIGAQFDVARVSFQMGLTYQEMEQIDRSQEYFEIAINFFEKIEAPKRVQLIEEAIFGFRPG
jgi:tetratricopeptide (TPR) repeat protein